MSLADDFIADAQGPKSKLEITAGSLADQFIKDASGPVTPKAMEPDPYAIKGEGYDRAMNYSGKDAIGGNISGAATIGATLLTPFDKAAQALGISNSFIGRSDRREQTDAGLTSSIGSNPESTAYQTNKLISQVAGTLPVGGALSKTLALIPGAAKSLPSLLPAIQSAGMNAGGATGLYGAATRVAGGAVNGALTAGAIDPSESGNGMMIGGATPLIAKALGAVGSAIGRPSENIGPNPTKLATAKAGMDAGYILPPATLQPTAMNRIIESFSGKDATKQLVSMRNSDVTEGLVRKALGIADDVPLTRTTMEDLRKTAGKAYADVSSISPQSATDLEALKIARNEATSYFNFYNRSADPAALVKAKDARALSDSLESALEGHAQAAGKPELVTALREARKQIAKTYTVGRALNDASGTVDSRILGRMSEKGMPLSDGLDVAGKFASAFPTATKTPMQMGSPAVSKLAAIGSTLLGSGGYAAMGPTGVAAATLPFIVPPLARSRMFSDSVQRGLLNPDKQGILKGLLSDSEVQVLPTLYKSSGLLGTGR